MGYMRHDAVVIVVGEHEFEGGKLPDIYGFCESLPEAFRQLVIGPVVSAVNGYYSYAFLPDGSKEGWRDSDQGEEYRAKFIDLFREATRWPESLDGVSIRFGGDEPDEVSVAQVRGRPRG